MNVKGAVIRESLGLDPSADLKEVAESILCVLRNVSGHPNHKCYRHSIRRTDYVFSEEQ